MKRQQRRVKSLDVIAQDAVRIASAWLAARLPDRFGPADPTLDENGHVWWVPVVLSYPGVTVGQIGEISISASSGEVVDHTDLNDMKTAGLALGRKHRAKVRAAFLRTRNA